MALMIMKICNACAGAKEILGMGMMRIPCPKCKASGLIENDDKYVDEFLAIKVDGEKESIKDERIEQEQIEADDESRKRSEEIKPAKRSVTKAAKSNRRKK